MKDYGNIKFVEKMYEFLDLGLMVFRVCMI